MILPGWGGPADDYIPLQIKLASRGYRVILPDFPGFGDSPVKYIRPEEWGKWIEDLAVASIGQREFIIFSHSGGGWIAFKYLKENRSNFCKGVVFLSPGLFFPWQSFFWKIIRIPFCFFAPFIFPKMKWVRNKKMMATAQAFLIPPEKHTQIKAACTVFLSGRDPIKNLSSGWKRISGCKIKKFDWDHSPQLRATNELVDAIDDFIKRLV
ncbi:MAG: alpha/beta fold hydrolase [Parcubacteria group bacterium]